MLKNTRLINNVEGTFLLVDSKKAKAGRILKLERDYFKSYSDSLTKQLEDSRTIIASLTAENTKAKENRATTQEIIDSERSLNLLTNAELEDLKKRFNKRGWTIVGTSGGGVLLLGGLLYVTLGPPLRK